MKSDPIEIFGSWFEEAKNREKYDPSAMTLSTATKEGVPSGRTVLLKGFDQEGFFFYTNYESRKSKEILENPYVSLTFFWQELQQQVLIEGKASKLSQERSEKYFTTRPRGSQISAWASKQGTVLPSREFLLETFESMEEKFKGKEVSLPTYWGGFCVAPVRIEFWQGKPNRMHDRVSFSKKDEVWEKVLLSP